MQVTFVVLLILIGTIPISGISQSFADQGEIPDWVKTTLSLWTSGEITNEEFVKAIDYLTERGVVEISSTNDKEIQRQMEYLKAKSEVFQEETKELREENKEYRVLLKSQEINKSEKFPTSMSKIFDEYQALQIEVKSLRETNQKMSKNIDAWVSNFETPELQVSSNIENDELVQVKSEFVNQLNNLKLDNKKYEDKIYELKENSSSYKNNIELLKMENENKKELILALKERNQENRESTNQLIQNEETYESMISNLRNESSIQKQKIEVYENKIKSLDAVFEVMNDEQIQNEQSLIKTEEEKFQYSNTIGELENINQEQKAELVSITEELSKTNDHLGILSEQINDYEFTIKTLRGESKLFENKINHIETEKMEYENEIT